MEANRSVSEDIRKETEARTATTDGSFARSDTLQTSATLSDREGPRRYWGHWSERVMNDERIKKLESEEDCFISIGHRHRKLKIGGFPDLARYMGDRRCETVFRSFASLRCRLMLYRQAEILELERELDLVERANDNPEVHRDIEWLLGKCDLNSLDYAQHQIVNILFEKLNEYGDLMLQQHELFKLPEPSASEVDDVYSLITNPPLDKSSPLLVKPPPTQWMNALHIGAWYKDEEKNRVLERDLVTLSSSQKVDKFSKLLNDHIVGRIVRFARGLAHRITGSKGTFRGEFVSAKAIHRISSGISLMFASTLPSISIFALFYIHPPVWKLVFLTVWTFLFTCALATLTTASKEQVFSASVAIAAVQVVFIGTSMTQDVTIKPA